MQGFFSNLVIFIIMGCGWWMKHSGRLTKTGLKEINTLLFALLLPVSFFKAGLGFNPSLVSGWKYPSVLFGAYATALLIAWIQTGMREMAPGERGAAVLTSVRPNSVFIGLPVITLWLGQEGAEAQLLFIAIGMLFYNTAPLILGQIATGERTDTASVVHALFKSLTNPIMLAGLAGMLLSISGITPHIPWWIMRAIKVLSDCATGLALLAIGASLKPEELGDDIKHSWQDIFMKLVIHPGIVFLTLLLFPLSNPVLSKALIGAAAMPPAVNNYVLAKGFGMDGEYTAILIASGTLLSIGTLMIWISLADRFF